MAAHFEDPHAEDQVIISNMMRLVAGMSCLGISLVFVATFVGSLAG